MTDSSDQNDNKPNEFEFNAADIPGLNLSSDQPASPSVSDPLPSFEMPAPEQTSMDQPVADAPPSSLSAPEPTVITETTEAPKAELDTIQKVKEFSEKMPMEKVQVPAAFPFSLLIEGDLTPEEKEKLLDVLSRENMGFREVDLEPQLAGNRILIPRISEYAGIILVQALRGTRAKMRLGPSETIFSAHDTEVTNDPYQPGMRLPEPEAPSPHARDLNHPAERIAVTPDSTLPQLPEFEVIDTIFATAILNSNAVEAERTSEYMDILENLKRELKYKAYRKGAVGLIHFKIDLQQLSLANQYRLMISGAAIRPRSGETTDTINSINSINSGTILS